MKEGKEVVSMAVFDNPVSPREVLLIRRPYDSEWAPGEYSPITGHVSEEDYREYEERRKIDNYSQEMVYVISGLREFQEEIKRSSNEPTQFQLTNIGSYNDNRTGYDVHVLLGFINRAAERIEDFGKNKVSVYPTHEALEVEWKNTGDVEKLIREGKIAGSKTFEMVFGHMKRFRLI